MTRSSSHDLIVSMFPSPAMTLGRQSHELTDFLKGVILVIMYITHYLRDVARIVSRPETTVQPFLKRFVEYSHYKFLPPSARPTKLRKREKWLFHVP